MGERLTVRALEMKKAQGDFEALHKAIEQGLGLLIDRSPLLVYDVTHRLGLYLKTAPQHVYLHAGPRVVADRLKLGLGRHRRLDPNNPDHLPTSLRTRLSSDQIENFLCLARRALHPGLWN